MNRTVESIFALCDLHNANPVFCFQLHKKMQAQDLHFLSDNKKENQYAEQRL